MAEDLSTKAAMMPTTKETEGLTTLCASLAVRIGHPVALRMKGAT